MKLYLFLLIIFISQMIYYFNQSQSINNKVEYYDHIVKSMTFLLQENEFDNIDKTTKLLCSVYPHKNLNNETINKILNQISINDLKKISYELLMVNILYGRSYNTKLLLQNKDIYIYYNNYKHLDPLCLASTLGFKQTVSLLLNDSRVDPSYDNDCAIRMASKYGHDDVVSLLLKDKRVNASAMNNYALRHAILYRHEKVISLLYGNTKVKLYYLEQHRLIKNISEWINLKQEITTDYDNILKMYQSYVDGLYYYLGCDDVIF